MVNACCVCVWGVCVGVKGLWLCVLWIWRWRGVCPSKPLPNLKKKQGWVKKTQLNSGKQQKVEVATVLKPSWCRCKNVPCSRYVYFRGTCKFEVREIQCSDVRCRCIRCIDVESIVYEWTHDETYWLPINYICGMLIKSTKLPSRIWLYPGYELVTCW